MTQLFQNSLFLVNFLYGLAFFLLGWSIVIRSPGRESQFSRSFAMIAGFGLLQGLAAWLEMSGLALGASLSLNGLAAMGVVRILALNLCFVGLLKAGLLLSEMPRLRLAVWLPAAWLGLLVVLSGYGALSRFDAAQWRQALVLGETISRLLLALPASVLICHGLWRSIEDLRYHHDARIAAQNRGALACFAGYGILAGIGLPLVDGFGRVFSSATAQGIGQLAVRSALAMIALGLTAFLVRSAGLLQKDENSRDAKTGLLTTPMIYRSISGCVQRDRTLSVLFIDIDHFKRINDRHGHLVGDEVLQKLAAILEAETRSIDCVGRFGGEEFVVVLPDARSAAAVRMAERLRSRIEQAVFPLPGTGERMPVTVSIGVAEWQPGLAIEQLLARADAAMYWAKAQGRNRVVASDLPQGDARVNLVRLDWHAQWESGHAEIDAQHQRLVALGNELIGLSLSGNGERARIVQQLKRVVEHVNAHFSFEERVLAELGYPDADGHAVIHRALADAALAFLERARRGEAQPQDCFAFVVNDLIVGHLLKDDVQFFAHIRCRMAGAGSGSTAAGQAPATPAAARA